MKIIISPAKKMRTDQGYPLYQTTPLLIDKTKILISHLKSLDYDSLKNILDCSDSIARESYAQYKKMDISKDLSAAILAFDGIQYKYMSPAVFQDEHFRYINDRLYIISGLYGLLRPLDGVVPYRLEMKAKLRFGPYSDLYDFWGGSICSAAVQEGDTVLNLASKEYSRCISRFVSEDVRYVNFTFGELIGDKVIEKGVYVKMARGEMVRYLAENNIDSPEDALGFNRLGFKYYEELSKKDSYVFIKERKK